jgi:hypothetical protein
MKAPRADANTIRLPSGVQIGHASAPGLNVSLVSVCRLKSQIQMSFS